MATHNRTSSPDLTELVGRLTAVVEVSCGWQRRLVRCLTLRSRNVSGKSETRYVG